MKQAVDGQGGNTGTGVRGPRSLETLIRATASTDYLILLVCGALGL